MEFKWNNPFSDHSIITHVLHKHYATEDYEMILGYFKSQISRRDIPKFLKEFYDEVIKDFMKY